jgi:hypothetical protein
VSRWAMPSCQAILGRDFGFACNHDGAPRGFAQVR